MPEITLDNVTKFYPRQALGIDGVTLHVADGELLALVGPSGCGKTTTLRLIAGLEEPSAGTIKIGGRVMNGRPPAERDLALVFQRPALYPHRTVASNLEFSLELRQRSGWWSFLTSSGRKQAKARCERVASTAGLLGLDGLLDRYPAQLSGGQQQRVALGRALVRQPGVLLLDEPLSNLDVGLRQELRRELHLLQRQLQATMVYVTHDPEEALSLGDRVAVLERGRLLQVDRPETVFERPASRFVARFVGWPPMNFLDGELASHAGRLYFVCSKVRLPVPASLAESWGQWAERRLTLGVRPEDVRIVDLEVPQAWPAQVLLVESFGQGRLVTVSAGPEEIAVWQREDCQNQAQMDIMTAGSKVMIQVQVEKGYLFDRATGAALTQRPAG
jgi:multiple sugar transport system ATP-binding protein